MKQHRFLMGLLAALAAVALLACGASEPEKKKPAPTLDPVKAKVTTVKKTGADSGKPIIEVTGTLPGTGWEPEVQIETSAEGTNVYIMAVPGPGAKKGAGVPFTHKFTLEAAPAGKAVRVFDHRGVQLKRF